MRSLRPVTRAFLAVALTVFVLCVWGIYSLFHLTPSKVIRINQRDPQLQAAIKEARDGLGAFIKELDAPKPDQRFAVKGTFQTPFGPEYLWVRLPAFKDGTFSGVLDQQPMAVRDKHKGDAVSFAEKDAVDWMIKDDAGTRGEFTEKVLGNR
jgi:uncharacterized protein YegJ (DUF2314 family)